MATIQQIGQWFEGKGNKVYFSDEYLQQEINAPRAVDLANISNLSFINGKYANRFVDFVKNTACKVLILDEKLIETASVTALPSDITYILSKNAKEDVILFCKEFLAFEAALSENSIHPSAVVAENVEIKGFVKIGANVVIEENVVLGKNVSIDANTLIKANTIIGDSADIGANNVIGGVGFGYSQNVISKKYEQFPHYGKVVIHNNVSIGNNTCIDRGSLSDTIIHDGVKIDNLVHIAHNVQIGENSLVIAQAMIAGSVKIGENCWIAPSSCIINGISIGNNVTVGLASTVLKSVADNQIMIGSPAVTLEEYRKKKS